MEWKLVPVPKADKQADESVQGLSHGRTSHREVTNPWEGKGWPQKPACRRGQVHRALNEYQASAKGRGQ